MVGRTRLTDVSSEQAYYESDGLWHQEFFDSEQERRRLEVAESFVPESAQSLLDVGCGQGAFLARLASRRPSLRLEGVERSRAAIEVARQRAPVRAGVIEALPYADRSFDVVSALEVLEHLPHRTYDAALRELERVAVSAVIVSVPESEQRGYVTCTYCGCTFQPNYHLRSFTRAQFGSLFQDFEIRRRESITTADYMGGPMLRRIRRTLSRRRTPPASATVCPQCGFEYSGVPSASDGPSAPSWIHRTVRAVMPSRPLAKWQVGLFTRRTPSGPADASRL